MDTPRGYAGDQSGIPPVEHVHGAVFAKVATVLTRAQEQLADIGGLHDCELTVTVPRALWQQLCEHDGIRRAVDGPAGAIIIEPDDFDCTGGT